LAGRGVAVFIIWTGVYWGVVNMSQSGHNIDRNIRECSIEGLVEYGAFPIISFVGEFTTESTMDAYVGVFSTDIAMKTSGNFFKYIRQYEDGKKRLGTLTGKKVFIEEDATISTAYLARIEARPRISLFWRLWSLPPFFVGTQKSSYWVAHVPPNSVFCEFEVKLK